MRKVIAALLALTPSGLPGCGSSPTPVPPQFTATFQEFPVPVSGNLPGDPHPGSWPDDMAGDAAGNIWFAMHHADEIGRMSPAGVYTGFPVVTPRGFMDSVVVDDARRTVWCSQVEGNLIVRLDMDTGAVREIPVPTANALPGDLALAADGTVWFVEGYEYSASALGKLGKIDPATNRITEISFPLPRGTLDGIALDSGGAVWVCEQKDNRIARYAGGTFTEYELPRHGSAPTNLTVDASDRIWVTGQISNSILRFDPSGPAWTEYPIPTGRSQPAGIALDSAGNVWYTAITTNKIGVLPAGAAKIVDFAIPTPNSHPEDIRFIGGGVWFSERYGNKIARITVPGISP